jgi:hypothetical protein
LKCAISPYVCAISIKVLIGLLINSRNSLFGKIECGPGGYCTLEEDEDARGAGEDEGEYDDFTIIL